MIAAFILGAGCAFFSCAIVVSIWGWFDPIFSSCRILHWNNRIFSGKRSACAAAGTSVSFVRKFFSKNFLKIANLARMLQGWLCYNVITARGTNNNRKEEKENDRTRLRIRCRSTSYTDNAFQIIQARDKRSISKGMKNDEAGDGKQSVWNCVHR